MTAFTSSLGKVTTWRACRQQATQIHWVTENPVQLLSHFQSLLLTVTNREFHFIFFTFYLLIYFLGEADDPWGTSLVSLRLWLPRVSYGHFKGLVHWSQRIHLRKTNILVTQMAVLYESICGFAGFSRPILTTLGKWLSNLNLHQNCLETC